MTKKQSSKVSERKRTMALDGLTPLAERTGLDGVHQMDFRALQVPVIFRVSIDTAGHQRTEYV